MPSFAAWIAGQARNDSGLFAQDSRDSEEFRHLKTINQ